MRLILHNCRPANVPISEEGELNLRGIGVEQASSLPSHVNRVLEV